MMHFLYNRKTITLASFMAFIILGANVVKTGKQKERNLKVLPKDISDQRLDSIMQTYNKALGVDCKFCHAKPLFVPFGSDPNSLDFASDKEPMKENARK